MVDQVFAKFVKDHPRKRLTYNKFLDALAQICSYKDLDFDDIAGYIHDEGGPKVTEAKDQQRCARRASRIDPADLVTIARRLVRRSCPRRRLSQGEVEDQRAQVWVGQGGVDCEERLR